MTTNLVDVVRTLLFVAFDNFAGHFLNTAFHHFALLSSPNQQFDPTRNTFKGLIAKLKILNLKDNFRHIIRDIL